MKGDDLSGQLSAGEKVLAVLGAFDPEHPALTLSEIARRGGLALSTAHRHTALLTGWGALERGADGRYRIGLRIWEVGSLAPRGLGLREAAMPYMEDLYEATHENVQLAVREGVEVVWVERIAGRTAVPVLTRVGGRFPLPATGGGLVLLAYAPQEVLDEVLSRPLERFTERTIVQQRALRSALAEVRRTGLAVSDRQVTMDALSVAAPVRGQGEQVVAALSLVVAAEGARPQAIAPAVLAAARAISRSLGSQQASASPAGENLRAPAYPAEPGFTGWAGRAGDTVRG